MRLRGPFVRVALPVDALTPRPAQCDIRPTIATLETFLLSKCNHILSSCPFAIRHQAIWGWSGSLFCNGDIITELFWVALLTFD